MTTKVTASCLVVVQDTRKHMLTCVHTHSCAHTHTHSLQHKPPRRRKEPDTHTKPLHVDTRGPKPRLRLVTQEGLGGALNWTDASTHMATPQEGPEEEGVEGRRLDDTHAAHRVLQLEARTPSPTPPHRHLRDQGP